MSDRKRFRARLRPFFLFVVALATTIVITPPAVHANTITVTTAGDEYNADGDCSLREAIVAANTDTAVSGCPAGDGADTILVLEGTYTLTVTGASEDEALRGDLDIVEDVTITGAGKSDTIIDANGLDRVFDVRADPSATVEISHLTVTAGAADRYGGGIQVISGTVTLARIRVRNSEADYGGGLYAADSTMVTVMDSRIYNNAAPAQGGGGIYVDGVVHLIRSLVDGNTTSGWGAGIWTQLGGIVVVLNSTISGNSTNFVGGGISNHGKTVLYNATIVQNIADAEGDNSGEGGGVYSSGLADLDFRNSIIADNLDNSSALLQHPDCSGRLFGYGNNLIEDMNGCTIIGSVAGNVTGVDPVLGPLQSNGGPTLTHALLAGSPAIDAGFSGGCASGTAGMELTVDQRGFARPVDGNGDGIDVCDIGAFERLSTGPPTPTATPTATATSSPTATPTKGTSLTPTNTPTATATATASPSPTPISTTTPGPSPTPAHTVTPGPSPTPTATSELPAGAQHKLYLPFFESEGGGQ